MTVKLSTFQGSTLWKSLGDFRTLQKVRHLCLCSSANAAAVAFPTLAVLAAAPASAALADACAAIVAAPGHFAVLAAPTPPPKASACWDCGCRYANLYSNIGVQVT